MSVTSSIDRRRRFIINAVYYAVIVGIVFPTMDMIMFVFVIMIMTVFMIVTVFMIMMVMMMRLFLHNAVYRDADTFSGNAAFDRRFHPILYAGNPRRI